MGVFEYVLIYFVIGFVYTGIISALYAIRDKDMESHILYTGIFSWPLMLSAIITLILCDWLKIGGNND
jgi:hypothetical protein